MTLLWNEATPAWAPSRLDGERLGLVGESALFRETMEELDALLARNPNLLLLRGETGTGKTLLARAVHLQIGRPEDPFLILPCSAFSPPILEEEIFGDPQRGRRGLLEVARSGTLLLDGAEPLDIHVQARLARILQGPRIRFPRVILTTRRVPLNLPGEDAPLPGLADAVGDAVVTMPPLRRRGKDVELLARHFLRGWAAARGVRTPRIEDDAVGALYSHPWPGNVRELRDVVRSAAEVAPGTHIRLEHLRIRTRETRALTNGRNGAAEMILIPTKGKSWDRIEEEAVRATLEITGGNRSQASRILGISRPTLTRKIRKYAVDIPPPNQMG